MLGPRQGLGSGAATVAGVHEGAQLQSEAGAQLADSWRQWEWLHAATPVASSNCTQGTTSERGLCWLMYLTWVQCCG